MSYRKKYISVVHQVPELKVKAFERDTIAGHGKEIFNAHVAMRMHQEKLLKQGVDAKVQALGKDNPPKNDARINELLRDVLRND